MDAAGLRARAGALLAIDVRSLAAFRIGIAAMLLADLAKRALTLELHYTDGGVLPRAVARELLAEPAWFARLHFAVGSVAGEALLFALAAAVAVALLVGYRSRLACALSWVLLLSVQMRNPLVNHTGDAYLLVLVFWGMFVPLGACASLDARRARADAPPPSEVRSVGAAALLLQIAVFYLAAGALKHDEAIWREGRALWLFLHEDAYARPVASALLPFEGLLRLGTWAALFLEGVAPLLFFSPWQTARVRVVLIALFTGFHLSIQLLVYIGIFELVSIAALAVFVPGCAWERLGWKLAPGARVLRPRGAFERAWQGVAAACGVYVLLSNAASLGAPVPELPRLVREAGRQLRLDQRWAIFTQLDGLDAGWFAVVAVGGDGARYDRVGGRSIASDADLLVRPAGFAESYANHNERRWWRHMRQPRFAAFRPAFAEAVCRRRVPGWDAASRPVRVRVVQVVERVRADGVTEAPVVEVLIDHRCATPTAS